jgi:hypothetical protein
MAFVGFVFRKRGGKAMVEKSRAEGAPRESGSYFARHWRGELSLARSWWLGGVLINGLCVGILFAIAAQTTIIIFDRSRAIAVVLLLAQIALTIVVYIWALIGTWRSAGRAGTKFWPIVARVLMVLGVFFTIARVGQSLKALECYASNENCMIYIGRGH